MTMLCVACEQGERLSQKRHRLKSKSLKTRNQEGFALLIAVRFIGWSLWGQPQLRRHENAAGKSFFPMKIFVAIFVVIAALQSAQAEANESAGSHLHILGLETRLVLDNSAAWVDFSKIFSTSASTVDAHFLAYQLNSEVIVLEKYVVQGGFLTGVSKICTGNPVALTMSNMIVTAGIGYRFTSNLDSISSRSCLTQGMMAFARYRYVGHITQIQRKGLPVIHCRLVCPHRIPLVSNRLSPMLQYG